MGLRRRGVGGPSGGIGRVWVDMSTRPAVSTTGDECARVMGGAVSALVDDECERRWLREKGDRLRGWRGRESGEVRGDEKLGPAGSVLRREVEGRRAEVSSGSVGSRSLISSVVGEPMVKRGSAARGVIDVLLTTAAAIEFARYALDSFWSLVRAYVYIR